MATISGTIMDRTCCDCHVRTRRGRVGGDTMKIEELLKSHNESRGTISPNRYVFERMATPMMYGLGVNSVRGFVRNNVDGGVEQVSLCELTRTGLRVLGTCTLTP